MAHQVLVVVVPSLAISSSCARDCVFTTRDMLRILAQEILICSSRPTKKEQSKEKRKKEDKKKKWSIR